MIKHKWIGAIAVLFMAVAVLALGFAYLNSSVFGGITGTPEPAYAEAMDKSKILDIQILADKKEWADMLEKATAEEYIPATVVINGERMENVGIRPKGNSSLSMVARDDTTDRYSFKIEFDHYITGQTWLGLDKLAVNNMQGDASYLKEYLSYDIMDYVGVEAPLYAFADISVNGEAWGFYLAVEGLEESYAKRVYGNDHGELYKPENMGGRGQGRMNEFLNPGNQNLPNAAKVPNAPNAPANLAGRFGGGMGDIRGMGGMAGNGVSLQYIDDNTSSYAAIFDNSVFDTNESDHKRVVNALKKLSKGEDLANVVDVEAVLKYFAAHTVVVNLDSYTANMGHNYYLYEKDGQLTILPWDYNLAFGGFQSGRASNVVNFPIDTPVSGVSLEERPLLGKLLEVPEYLELYHGYLQQIVDGYFNSGLFEQTVDAMNALIAPYVAADPSAFYDYEAYQTAVGELKKLGLLRAASIEGQLKGTVPSTSEGQSADPAKLIDASGVNLAALGSQGGMGGGGMGGGLNREPGGMGGFGLIGGMQDFDPEKMQKAMEILREAGENELSEEQLARLKELGFTDEQITQFKNMSRWFLGGVGGRPSGNLQGGGNNPPAGQNPGSGNQAPVKTTGTDLSISTPWLVVGGCAILLLAGLAFVVLFQRRRGV